MTTSTQIPKLSSHSRSISLPTSSHPLITDVEEHLQRLRSSGDASSSHTSTCKKLDGLKNVYECLDDVLHLSQSHQILSSEESVVNGSLRILDICSEVREIYSQMKGNVQQLESSLRRKRSGDFSDEVSTYKNLTKHLNKMISKCYKELRKATKITSLAVQDNNLIDLIQEIQLLSVSILESTLSYISSNTKGTSFVSKVIKGASRERKSEASTIKKIEALLNNKNSNSVSQIQSAVKQLEQINSSIQESEELLETVFRQLVKSRVSLLNILSH